MSTLINYFVEANLGLLLFAVIYWLFLRNENQFSFNRAFLLAGILFSLLFPLWHFNSPSGAKMIPSVSEVMPSYWLPEVIVRPNDQGSLSPAMATVPVWPILEWVYTIVALGFTVLFVIRLIKIGKLFLASRKYRWNTCLVAESEERQPTFSFFNFIFIGQANQLTPDEKQEVMVHEWIHVRKLHSFDIILINLLAIGFWFNPVVRMYRKTLVQLHEFETDARSVENHDADSYCRLLAKVALESTGIFLVNHFNHSLTLKRITMMQTMKKKIQLWKLIVLSATVPLLFLAVACQEQVISDLQDVSKNSAAAGLLPLEVKKQLDVLQKNNPSHEYIVIQMNEEGKKTLDKLQFENAQTGTLYPSMTLINTDKNSDGGGFTYVILEKGSQTSRIADATGRFDKAYTMVDDMPEYVGGIDSLMAFIQKKMKYPGDARKKGIEGRVFVSFVVTKEGDVVDPAIAKGVAAEIDKEALSVVSSFPKWIPGRQHGEAVDVKFVLPINFKINN
ncbi:MAG TPA: M56 family metallopeptidase [Cyclobacteriaceae bacterium]|nr:M56 family metallopeptidase [Cyclobacteriaceae bacterium]